VPSNPILTILRSPGKPRERASQTRSQRGELLHGHDRYIVTEFIGFAQPTLSVPVWSLQRWVEMLTLRG
jgi:hypothetical protein